uniref:Uncharacterized protein n=1 Tax=Hyaloperonospora arabidopsidis (strain Emoy2) TaxID=559515 RepID=M4B4J9_HYAAE
MSTLRESHYILSKCNRSARMCHGGFTILPSSSLLCLSIPFNDNNNSNNMTSFK